LTVPHAEPLAPLLNIINSNCDVTTLAEVASFLAEVTCTDSIAEQLRSPYKLAALQVLAQIGEFSVAFPFSEVLSRVHKSYRCRDFENAVAKN